MKNINDKLKKYILNDREIFKNEEIKVKYDIYDINMEIQKLLKNKYGIKTPKIEINKNQNKNIELIITL
jgi:hypothetical protein